MHYPLCYLTGKVTRRFVHQDVVQVAQARDVQEGGSHYREMNVQPWDVIDTWPREQRIGFHRGNALKYLMRMGTKDEQIKEIRKARHYLDKLLEVLDEPPG